MSLGFRFNLTPAQTKLLVRICYLGTKFNEAGFALYHQDGPSDFVSIIRRLIDKGLVLHFPPKMHERPFATFKPTAEGLAIANLVLRDAEELITIADSGEQAKPATHTQLAARLRGARAAKEGQ